MSTEFGLRVGEQSLTEHLESDPVRVFINTLRETHFIKYLRASKILLNIVILQADKLQNVIG